MAYKLVITRSAELDLDAIIEYIAGELRNPEAAIKLLDEVEKHYDILENNPFLYARCTHPLLVTSAFRKVVIGSYLFIYRVDETTETVYVERFFSELQDYADKL